MALKFAAPLPLFLSNPATPSPRPAPFAEVRFSRWNNANAEPVLMRRRSQQEIEDDLHHHRSALKIAEDTAAADAPAPSPAGFHPGQSLQGFPKGYCFDGETGFSVGDKGITYRIEGAPFEFEYSYTETPKVKPLALREPPFLPFGPSTMPRPWTGRAPLPPSKKKLPEFDSFKLPPPEKKGVKPVQSPGPFLAGSGPKYHAASREKILGEPLTQEEIKELVKGCLKIRRQLNIRSF